MLDFLRREKPPKTWGKTLKARESTNKQLNSHITRLLGMEPRPRRLEMSKLKIKKKAQKKVNNMLKC
jgi:hypothetical protein